MAGKQVEDGLSEASRYPKLGFPAFDSSIPSPSRSSGLRQIRRHRASGTRRQAPWHLAQKTNVDASFDATWDERLLALSMKGYQPSRRTRRYVVSVRRCTIYMTGVSKHSPCVHAVPVSKSVDG